MPRIRGGALTGTTEAGADWQVRVVRNRFPAVRPDAVGSYGEGEPYVRAPAAGRHEVIIESPRHRADLPDLPDGGMRAVVEAWRARHTAAAEATLRPILFRNRGPGAGASQDHPHSQLIATAFGAPRLEALERRAVRYRGRTGACLFCRVMDAEREDGRRILWDDGSFLAFVPFAALPYETWVVSPHGARFETLGQPKDGEADAFAHALRTVLGLLRERAGDPEYSLVLHIPPEREPAIARAAGGGRSAPKRRRAAGAALAESVHWHVRIRPRVLKPGGLEVAAGVSVSPLLPERSANILRGEADPS